LSKVIFIFCVVAGLFAIGVRSCHGQTTWPEFIYALEIVESGRAQYAVGDDGESLGILQIQCAVVLDVNGEYGFGFECNDVFHIPTARCVAWHYLRMLGKRYERETGKPPTWETYARMWVGGAHGWSKEATVSYWQRVKRYL
jgi:hypothetical protein